MVELVELVVGLLLIVAASDLFTNGIEWLGRLYRLSEGAVASVLAAIGTALPETMVPIVAILLAGRQTDPAAARDVGVGAVLGAPFMLATLAMFVTGTTVVLFRRRRASGEMMSLDRRVVFQDVRFFVVAYAIALAAALLPSDLLVVRYLAVVVLLGAYALYVKGHFAVEGSGETEDLAPLRLHRVDRPGYSHDQTVARIRIVIGQLAVALVMIVVGALVFVDAVEKIAHGAGLDPVLLSLIVAPIATELPEAFNSVIWVRQGKDTLALGNITGAMVFQACIPTSIAVALAPAAWAISPENVLGFSSALMAYLSVGAIFLVLAWRASISGRRLLLGGVFYVAYVGLVIAHIARVF